MCLALEISSWLLCFFWLQAWGQTSTTGKKSLMLSPCFILLYNSISKMPFNSCCKLAKGKKGMWCWFCAQFVFVICCALWLLLCFWYAFSCQEEHRFSTQAEFMHHYLWNTQFCGWLCQRDLQEWCSRRMCFPIGSFLWAVTPCWYLLQWNIRFWWWEANVWPLTMKIMSSYPCDLFYFFNCLSTDIEHG